MRSAGEELMTAEAIQLTGQSEEARAFLMGALALGFVKGSSDWHFTCGEQAALRVEGLVERAGPELIYRAEFAPILLEHAFFIEGRLDQEEAKRVLSEDLKDPRRKTADFEARFSLDEGKSMRMRVHVKWQRGQIGFTMRRINDHVKSMDEIGTPEGFRRLLKRRKGLILVCGETGSGKSTTLAAALAWLLRNEAIKLVAYEDPIEAEIPQGKGVVEQHRIGGDIPDYLTAIKSAMREDPDLILAGELRSPETIETALIAADTGHLVFSTMHSGDAQESIVRLMGAAPEGGKEFFMRVLGQRLLGVLCQRLVRAKNKKRVAVYEFMYVNTAVRGAIQDGKPQLIRNAISSGISEGMFLFSRHLAELVHEGVLDEATAEEEAAGNLSEYQQALKNLKEGSAGGRSRHPAGR